MDNEILEILEETRRTLNNQVIHWAACKKYCSYMDWLAKLAHMELFKSIKRIDNYTQKMEENQNGNAEQETKETS